MNVYPEIKKIAEMNAERDRLNDLLADQIDCAGIDWPSARLIADCVERDGHLYRDGGRLDNSGLVDDDYYCDQHAGYCEDDYHGTLYFRTDVPGQFVAIPYST